MSQVSGVFDVEKANLPNAECLRQLKSPFPYLWNSKFFDMKESGDMSQALSISLNRTFGLILGTSN